MSVTGCCLILFVTFHVLMNGVALFWPAAYNVICEFLGANWYALVGSAGLAVLFLLHILYASWLTVQNRRARGAERYEVTARPKQVEWSSKNMYILGLVILAFLVVHLIQFWTKMQFAEMLKFQTVDCVSNEAVPAAAGTWMLELAFRQPLTLPIYLVAFIALWLHMNHGFWSMFQTAGWNGKIWLPRLKKIGLWWTTIVVGLFIAEAITFTVQAHRHAYTTNPELIEQYQQMYRDADGVMNAPTPEGETGIGSCGMPQCANANCAGNACTANQCGMEQCDGQCAKCADCPQGACNAAACAPGECANGACAQATCAEGAAPCCQPQACADCCKGQCDQCPDCVKLGCDKCPGCQPTNK